MSVADFRRACRAYATRFIDVMTRRVPAPGRVRRLGTSLPDDGLQVPGGDRARAGEVRRAGPGLQGQEAGPLVHPLPDRAGGSRSRVRGSHLAVDLRRVPALAGQRRRARPPRAGAGRARGLRADLDDDALDDSVEPGDRVPSGLRLRGVRGRRPRRDRGRSAGARRSPRRPAGRSARRWRGSRATELEHIRFQHPLYARASLGVLADYVTVEQGTGAVHTAPGHGATTSRPA